MSRCLRELFFDPSPSFVGKRQRLDSIGSRMAGSQLRHIVLRVKDLLDLHGQGLESALHLGVVAMTIIDCADTRHNVTEGALGMIARHAGTAHERTRGASQIVQGPPRNAARLIKCRLEF
jgi:hypothetical protein